jgi:hypothetical protein
MSAEACSQASTTDTENTAATAAAAITKAGRSQANSQTG